MFSEKELAYLKSQYLARLGTVSVKGQPTVDAVGFEFDGARFYVGGINLPASRKYKNVAAAITKYRLSLMIWHPFNPGSRAKSKCMAWQKL